MIERRRFLRMMAGVPLLGLARAGQAGTLAEQWPRTDLSHAGAALGELVDSGLPRDGISSIDEPAFGPIDRSLDGREPVVGLDIGGDCRAYPVRILIWHWAVNDVVGGVPVTVTYCPLSDAGLVYDRRVGARELDFGTSGKLRRSNWVMFDRATESLWQHYTGEALAGELAGTVLDLLPARVESIAAFAARAPMGRMLRAPDTGRGLYGTTPYVGYDGARWPFLYRGAFPNGLSPMTRVVAVGDEAWSWPMLRRRKRLQTDHLTMAWMPGRCSAQDTAQIAAGRDLGSVVVQRRMGLGAADAAHRVSFAFTFHAFRPACAIRVDCAPGEAGAKLEPPLACG